MEGRLPGSFDVTVWRWRGGRRGPPEKLRRKEEEARRSAVKGPTGPSCGVRDARDRMAVIDNEGFEGEKSLGRRGLSGAGDMVGSADDRLCKSRECRTGWIHKS